MAKQSSLTMWLCGLLVLTAVDSVAIEVEPGVPYLGEARLEFSQLGASILLPEGWAGQLSPDGEIFMMECQTIEAYVFAAIDEATAEEALETMSAPIDLGDGVVLHPEGEVHNEAGVLTSDYSVRGSEVPLVGRVMTVVGEGGLGVALIAASTPGNVEAMKSALAVMGDSITIEPPAKLGASTGNGVTAGGPWVGELAGHKLTHFFTRSGYTEEDYIWLCPDGRFYRSFNAGGFGGGASGAFESGNGGTWSASGPIAAGTLHLMFNDGSSSQYELTLDGTKLFLDGGRYFREATDCR